jgi:acyl-[acyl-carrier-protein]-phospholipid O-acyltransferase/long-chain-fatty-acid--[acyl-carrier-protein] ligase
MVPHLKIEEALTTILGGDEDHLKAVVTAVPDPFRGERLVVVHVPLNKKPEEVCRALSSAGLPNLWVPSPDSFVEVSEIPVLGTGKLDLHGLKQLALSKFAPK